jgi:hypothetical protein
VGATCTGLPFIKSFVPITCVLDHKMNMIVLLQSGNL